MRTVRRFDPYRWGESASVICLDVFPTDSRNLRNPASEQVRTLEEHVVALGLGAQVSGPIDGRHQQPELLRSQRRGWHGRQPVFFMVFHLDGVIRNIRRWVGTGGLGGLQL